MAKQGNRIISISINNEYIKVCEMSRKNKNNVIIHKAVTVETPPRCYGDGTIRDRAQLAKAIKIAMDSNRMESTRAIFSIASSKVATKEVIIPNVKPNKIGDIIFTNASEYFPVQLEEYIVNYTVLEKVQTEGAEPKIKVMVMAMPEQMVNSYYDLASSLGLKVYAIDFVGNSTNQALKIQVDNAPSVVIQVENDSTIVNIYDNNVLQLQRTIPYGKSVVVNALMDEARIKYEPALRKLQEEPIIHKTFDGDPVTESLGYLITNVSRIIDFYTSRNSQRVMEKAYIIGNATTINGFADLFANELKLPIESIDILKGVLTDKKTYVEESMIPSYIINIGAFIAPVNFVPHMSVDETKVEGDMRIFHVMLGASIVGAILLVGGSATMMASAKAERDTAQASVNTIKGIESVVNDYYEAKDIASDAEAFRVLTLNNDDVLAQFITDLEKNLPSDVSIRSMNVSSGEVTVSGITSSKSSLGLMVQMLKSIDNVKDVLVGSESEAMDNDGVISVTFSLTCTFVNTSTLTEEEASQGAATSTNVTQAATTAATQAATTAATQAATTESTQAASVAAATQAATR